MMILFLGIISFIAVLISVAQFAFEIYTNGQSANSVLQLQVIGLVFILAIICNITGLKSLDERSQTRRFLTKIYSTICIFAVSLSYIAIAFILFQEKTNIVVYVSLSIAIIIHIVWAESIHPLIESSKQKEFWLRFGMIIMSISVIYSLLFVGKFTFTSIPPAPFVIGHLTCFTVMSLLASNMMFVDALQKDSQEHRSPLKFRIEEFYLKLSKNVRKIW